MPIVKFKKPYKINRYSAKRYEGHYQIPADRCVVIPVKQFGHDIACDVRWKEGDADINEKKGILFSEESLEPLDAMRDFELYELYQQYTETVL